MFPLFSPNTPTVYSSNSVPTNFWIKQFFCLFVQYIKSFWSCIVTIPCEELPFRGFKIKGGLLSSFSVFSHEIGKIEGNYKIGYKIRWSSSKYDYSYRVYLRDFTIKND